MELTNKIETVLRQVINVDIKMIDHHDGLTSATLENGSKWVVNHDNLNINIYFLDDDGELKNSHVVMNLNSFKQWDNY